MPTFRQDEKLGTNVPLIKTADFNDKSVTTEKLAEGSVTNSKLAPESVTQDKFDKELLKIFEAAAGLPENLIETIQKVDSTLVDHQRQISSNDDDISDLQTKTKQIKDTVDGIAVSGGASVGSAVTYDNTQSGLDAQNIQNAIDELVNNLGHYETNEEWLRVYTDAENKFLWGIRVDGSIDWAVGIPKPIQKTLNEIIANNETFQQTLTEAMEAYKATIDEKVAAIDKKKVDKEEGKSLIEDEVKERFRVIENEEFIKAVVDSEDRVLFGFYRATGKPYYPLNEMYHVIQNEEFLWVILDAANHPLLGIQQDGTSWAAKAQWLDDIKAIKEALKTFQPKEDGKGLINLDVADSFFYISNDEYIIAVVDAENRILAAIKYDAQPYFPNHEMYSVIANEEWLYAIIDAENKVLGGFRADDGHMVVGGIDISTFITNAIIDIADIKECTNHLSTIENDEYLAVEQDAEGKVLSATNTDGSHYIHKVKSETILTQIEEKTDIENRLEMTLDEEGHILSYRDNNGVKHETALDVKHLDVEHFSMKGESIDFSNYATQDDVNGIELKNIDGVYDNSKPNLYLTSQKTYTTADGKQSFTPPNEGAEMSNKIPCKPGEWFTRTGTATGMVVVSDKNDNNAKRLMPNGSLPKASVQVPEYWDWAAYIRFAVATYENNVTINRGKYAVSESSDSVSIPKLKLNVANFTKETKYLKSPNGTFFELSVSDKGVLSVKEIDKDLVAPFDVPSDLKFTISNPSGGAAVFCGNANRVLLHNEKYLYEVKETGLTKFLSIADSSAYFYNVEHQVNSSGKSRIVALLKVDPFKDSLRV
ncbi:MAG: hypothetical protein ACLR8W_11335 [Segatella copri]